MTVDRTERTGARRYWQHAENGEVWAIETTDGQPVRCCGPVCARDAGPILLPHLIFAQRDLDLIRADRHHFQRYEIWAVCHGVPQLDASTTHIGATGKLLHLACTR
jgi:hypothetical protein